MCVYVSMYIYIYVYILYSRISTAVSMYSAQTLRIYRVKIHDIFASPLKRYLQQVPVCNMHHANDCDIITFPTISISRSERGHSDSDILMIDERGRIPRILLAAASAAEPRSTIYNAHIVEPTNLTSRTARVSNSVTESIRRSRHR